MSDAKINAPWQYVPCGDSDGEVAGIDHFVMDANGDQIACAPNEMVGRLIAAGPDMRSALEYVADMLNQSVPDGRGGTETMAQRLAAVGGVRAESLVKAALAAAGGR